MSAPARPSRNARWLLACLLCTVGGSFIGRQTRTHASVSAVSAPATLYHPTAAHLAQSTSTVPLDAVSRPSPANRRAALAALLRGFGGESEPVELDSLMALAAWFGAVDQKELAQLADFSTWDDLRLQSEQAAIALQLLLFSRWASLDGPAALKACLAQTKNRALLDTIFKSWLKSGDAQAAIDHALALQRSDAGAPPLIGELLTTWYKQDPAAAVSRARELATSENGLEREAARQVAAEAAHHSLDTESVDAALNFIAAWPDQGMHDQLLVSLLVDWNSTTSHDLDAAGRILSRVRDPQSVARADTFAPLASSIDSLLSFDKIAEVRRWCANLSATFQPLAVNQIARKLAARDQWHEALAWLQAHPAPPKTYADAYDEVASAAARDGEMTQALSLPGQGDSKNGLFNPRSRLVQDWIQGDSARADILIDFIIAAEASGAPGAASR